MSYDGSSVLEAEFAPSPVRARIADRALVGLAGSDLSERFRTWRGRSGQRYIFSVFRSPDIGTAGSEADFTNAVVIAASRDLSGERRVVLVTSTDGCPDLVFHGRAMADARAAGANEIHIHLLAAGKAERRAIVEDLVGAI